MRPRFDPVLELVVIADVHLDDGPESAECGAAE
jgi:hypothetical protein